MIHFFERYGTHVVGSQNRSAPESLSFSLPAFDQSTVNCRPDRDEDSVSRWAVIPCKMHLAMRPLLKCIMLLLLFRHHVRDRLSRMPWQRTRGIRWHHSRHPPDPYGRDAFQPLIGFRPFAARCCFAHRVDASRGHRIDAQEASGGRLSVV